MPDLLDERYLLPRLSLAGADLREGLISPALGVAPTLTQPVIRPQGIPAKALQALPAAAVPVFAPGEDLHCGSSFSLQNGDQAGSLHGELVERYASLIIPENLSQPGPASARQLSLESFLQFTDEQYASPDFPYRDPRTLNQVHYYPARRAIDNLPVTVPAELVFLTGVDAKRWCTISSSGLGAGRSRGSAAASAFYELIERDAFLRTWYARRGEGRLAMLGQEPALLASALGMGAELPRMLQKLRLRGIEATLVQLPAVAGVPVILSCLRSGTVGLAVGCAAKSAIGDAARTAFTESLHSYNWAMQLLEEEPAQTPPEAELDQGQSGETIGDTGLTLRSHVQLHAPPANRPLNDFLDTGPEAGLVEFFSTPAVDFTAAISGAHDSGWELCFAEIAPAVLHGTGWYVIRALAPQAVTLDVGIPHLRQLGEVAHATLHPFP
ncbi:YcaO-like family protein [Acaricomes phytoseiuli]|uniref:YcaO-like family protein n=1 Tax=Acaricomes phytoseiuli TaxID=291968 RepID=UPI00222235D0|nr:YcaO-like family protein [Acaricomes phytoseiuli]MCW1249740.1 YcaO-like family protein [Acaricomes phytoseiuli]